MCYKLNTHTCSLFIMQKNYIQFLVLALVAIGMVMIAGIRNDVNSLESQVAFTGRALVNKTAEESGTAQKVANTPVKTFSISEIENTIKKLGFVKQLDNSYSAGGGVVTELHYLCPNCQVGGGCCVQNGIGSWSNSGSEGCGNYGTVVYGGLCSVSRVAGGSGASSDRTTSGSTGSGSTAERPKACKLSETCPQGQACKNGSCVPCIGQGCIDGASRSGTSNPILTTTLRLGSISSEVTKLQKMLVSLGFLSTAPSGNFLSKTEAGVKAFQTAYGISPVSGIVGPLTRAKLNSMCTISSDGSVVSCSQ